MPLSPMTQQCVPGRTAPSAHCPIPSGTPKHPPSSTFTAPSQSILAQGGRQLRKGCLLARKAAFSPKVWFILWQGHWLDSAEFTLAKLPETAGKATERTQSKQGREGRRSALWTAQSITANRHLLYCCHKSQPFWASGERQIMTWQSPKASKQRAWLCLGCLPPAVLSPNLGNLQGP